MRKAVLYFFVLAIFSFTLVSAVPGIPHQLYGNVEVNGVPVPDGTAVIAQVDGDTYITFTKDGKYGFAPNIFYVEDPDGNRNGKSITLSLNYKSVQNILFSNNGYINLELTTETTCGDNFCLGNENYNSCSIDCPTPPVNNNPPASNGGSGGSGGGSGGGGGGESTIPGLCIEVWECTIWDDCANGKQTRSCNDLNKCGTTRVKPIETRTCSSNNEQTLPGQPSVASSNENEIKNEKGFWSKITGFAISDNGTFSAISLIPLIVLIFVIIVAFVFVRNRRKRYQR